MAHTLTSTSMGLKAVGTFILLTGLLLIPEVLPFCLNGGHMKSKDAGTSIERRQKSVTTNNLGERS